MSWGDVDLGDLIEPAKVLRAGNRSYPILSMTMRHGLIEQGAKFKKRIASADTSPYKVVLRNQLVVGFPIDEGVLSFQDLHDSAIVSPAYDIWNISNSSCVHPKYLERFLRSPRALAYYSAKLRGSTARRRSLPADLFLSLRVPLPPLGEQMRVAEVLDRTDALCQKRRLALQMLDDLLQSVFIDKFGDPLTNPKGWTVVKSALLLTERPKLGTTRKANGTGYLVVRVGEIGGNRIEFSDCGRVELSDEEFERYVLQPGDIVLARAIGSRAQLGKASLFCGYSESVVADSHVMRLRPNAGVCDSRWLYTMLSSERGKVLLQNKGGATAVQFNINTTQASDLDVPLPPIELQREFGRFAIRLERHMAKQVDHLAGLYRLFSSLQSRAFGKDN